MKKICPLISVVFMSVRAYMDATQVAKHVHGHEDEIVNLG